MIPTAIILAIVLSGALGISLMYRQAAAVAAHRDHVPDAFAGWISAGNTSRAAAYTLARTRLAIAETVFDTVLAVLWLFVLLGPLYALVAHFVTPGLSRAVAVVVAFALIGRVLYLPFSIYSTFALEARFGFNRATPAMFLRDRIKGVALSALLGVPLLYGLFWLLRVMPDTWWLLGWATFMAVTNRHECDLSRRHRAVVQQVHACAGRSVEVARRSATCQCGFASKGLYVMDASRRSTHGNAYFTGFGKAKRIVFFDTLLQNHTPDEILSILAHELGHYKLGHIGQRIAEMAALTFVGFAVLRWAFGAGGLAGAFGLPADPGVVLIVVLTATGPVSHLLSPLTSWLSRRAEYQADNFAKAMAGSGPMISALTKLARDNLSTLTPDALYALFYYSHPPVPARIARLSAEPALLDRIRI